MLYTLSFSRHVPGFAASVRTTPRQLAGYLNTETSELVGPDLAAVREALPPHWRPAFDRNRDFWFPKDDARGMPSMELRDKRGKYLTTLYAKPYYYNPKA